MNIFKKKLLKVKDNSFKVGQIYKMNPTKHSHVNKPYFVEVIEVGTDYIVTNIPFEHTLKITKEGVLPNWDYHISRMEYAGEKGTHYHLLLNQKLRYYNEISI